MAVLRISTKSPHWKLKFRIVLKCAFLNQSATLRLAAYTREWMRSKSSGRFCNARARHAIKLVTESTDSGGGLRYVASTMSRGIKGCVPVAM